MIYLYIIILVFLLSVIFLLFKKNNLLKLDILELNNSLSSQIKKNEENLSLFQELNWKYKKSLEDIKLNTDKNNLLQNKINELLEKQNKEIKAARTDAVEKSKVVLKGKISEEICPLLPNFPYKISDLKFCSQPIDYIVYNGLGEDNITELILLEIKTGNAVLNSRQKQIKRCVEENKIKFQVYNIDRNE